MTKRKTSDNDFPTSIDNVPITQKMLTLATSELSHAIHALDYKIEAQLKGIDARLIEISAKFDARLIEMNAKFDTVDAKFDALNAKFDAAKARSDAQFNDLKGLVELVLSKISDTLLLTEQQKTQNAIAMEAVQVYRESFDARLRAIEDGRKS